MLAGVVAQLVERLFRIQEAWGSTPHYSIFFIFLPTIPSIFFDQDSLDFILH